MKRVVLAIKTRKNKIASVIFWILLWQFISMAVNKDILLASPVNTIKALGSLVIKAVFLKSILHSFLKIMAGFFFAAGAGILLAVLAWRFLIVRELIHPLMKVIQATPVASFIILALLFISSRNLSILTAFLMTVPVIYTNVLQGIGAVDQKLLEMAAVFKMSTGRIIRYLYIPAIAPFFSAASTVGLGLCFKAGIAAEVIAIPKNSIGEQLYIAKLYLMTGDLFAWTFVIIILSVITERLYKKILERILKKVS